MTKMKTVYLGNLRTEAEHLQSGNKIITDAPLDNNGKGEAFSPTDLLATSLGSCMLTIMGISAPAYGYNLEGTVIETEKIMGTNPRRVVELKLDITFPKDNNYTDQQKPGFSDGIPGGRDAEAGIFGDRMHHHSGQKSDCH